MTNLLSKPINRGGEEERGVEHFEVRYQKERIEKERKLAWGTIRKL